MSKRLLRFLPGLRGNKSPKKTPRPAHASHYRPALQTLESRVLLDGNPLNYQFPANQVLHAVLREATDNGILQIQVVRDTTILVEQAVSDTSSVIITGLAGNDTLVLDATVPATLPITVNNTSAPGN